MTRDVAFSTSERLIGLPPRIAENMDVKAAAISVIASEVVARSPCATFSATSDLRQPGYDFSWTRNHRGRSQRVRLRNHGANVVLDDKQLFTDVPQLLQNKSGLFDADHLPQVRVYHEDAVRADLHVTISQQLGVNVIWRFQHRANSRYLRRLISDEMNEHFKTR